MRMMSKLYSYPNKYENNFNISRSSNTIMTNLKEITTIHLLVHPGYIHKKIYVEGKYPEYHIPLPTLEHLAECYVKKAATLPADAIMILFAPTKDQNFAKEMRSQEILYTKIIREIKQVLGNRLITLVDDTANFDKSGVWSENKEKLWKRIQNIVQARGFYFSKDVTASAYGEAMNCCVNDIASNLHEAGNFTQPITIDAGITDYIIEEHTYHCVYDGIDEKRRGEGNEIHLTPGRTKVKFK